MIIFWFIYILGIVVTLWTCYHALKVGDEVPLIVFFSVLICSLFSWVSFCTVILIIYGDKIVFKKK